MWLKRSPISGIAGGDRITTSARAFRVIIAGGKNQGLDLLRISPGESESHQRSPRMSENDCAWNAHFLEGGGNEVSLRVRRE